MNLEDNPLLLREEFIRYDLIKPEHFRPALNHVFEELESQFEKIEANHEPTWEGLMKPLEDLSLPIEYTWNALSHLLAVKNKPELRKIHAEFLPRITQFVLKMGQSPKIYRALKNLRKTQYYKTLSNAKRRAINIRLFAAKSSGIELEGSERDEFNRVVNEMKELESKFSNNLLDSLADYRLIITEPADSEGWPDSLLSMTASSYNEAFPTEAQKATPENGPWLITLAPSVFMGIMKHCKNREIRKKVHTAYVTRATEPERDSAPIINRMLELRKKQASLLGFETFADFSLTNKMAKTPANVQRVLHELEVASKPFAEKEKNDLEKLALANGQKDPIMAYDVPYWAEQLREQLFDYKDEDIRPYFPLDNVLQGMFDLAAKLFDVSIGLSDYPNYPKWDKEVRLYDVKNSEGKLIARFYLDPFSRPGQKRSGAWMSPCFNRRIINGNIKNPLVYIVCNAMPPIDGKPSLLNFTEINTLFHEFGHALQAMLTTVDESEVAGVQGIEWDAVELASQFMERWCVLPSTLKAMSKHYITGEPLPKEIVHKICDSKKFQAGFQMLRQISLARTDLYLHSEYNPKAMTPFEAARKIEMQTTVYEPIEENKFLCSFGHIFAGPYASAYYSYKWAEILSSDAFSAFEEVGLDDDEAMRRVGKRFKETILASGGSIQPDKLFKAFRGREPSVEPLLRHSGLLAPIIVKPKKTLKKAKHSQA
ncbi:MAG: M3 family metallopeptidase [Candidatus Riflebacteria bacterium]|nr:M3 family metallopeptidase [Candidatus Riflebacteria bacterium]